jgi:hypothetical protein
MPMIMLKPFLMDENVHGQFLSIFFSHIKKFYTNLKENYPWENG